MTEPLYPEISVQLSGEDGNAFAILGNVKRAMQRGGLPKEVIDQFREEAMSGDYDNLLSTCMRYVTVD